MRTPNTQCEICGKPLYRRPFELKKYNGVCCISCCSELYKQREPSPNLILGREKGTNHLRGIPKSEGSKIKRAISMVKWCKENPAKVKARGKKCRAENHYNWKGGILNIGQSIRRMWECEKWRDDVKARDQKCQLCGSVKNLESHHIIPIQMIIEIFQIKNREDARNCKELWDIKNGVTLCRKCHYKLHGRKYAEY